jgi:hypothetical protein
LPGLDASVVGQDLSVKCRDLLAVEVELVEQDALRWERALLERGEALARLARAQGTVQDWHQALEHGFRYGLASTVQAAREAGTHLGQDVMSVAVRRQPDSTRRSRTFIEDQRCVPEGANQIGTRGNGSKAGAPEAPHGDA